MSNPIVPFDEQAVGDELRELVRKTTEEAIDAMSGEGADRLVGARPYERTNERAAYRAGHYERGFTTTSGQVTLKMSKLKRMRFGTAVIERCKRRGNSAKEVIIRCTWPGRASSASPMPISWLANAASSRLLLDNRKYFARFSFFYQRRIPRMENVNLEQVLSRYLPRTQYPNGVGGDSNNLIEVETRLLSFLPNCREHVTLVCPRVALFEGIKIHVT